MCNTICLGFKITAETFVIPPFSATQSHKMIVSCRRTLVLLLMRVPCSAIWTLPVGIGFSLKVKLVAKFTVDHTCCLRSRSPIRQCKSFLVKQFLQCVPPWTVASGCRRLPGLSVPMLLLVIRITISTCSAVGASLFSCKSGYSDSILSEPGIYVPMSCLCVGCHRTISLHWDVHEASL